MNRFSGQLAYTISLSRAIALVVSARGPNLRVTGLSDIPCWPKEHVGWITRSLADLELNTEHLIEVLSTRFS